MPIYGHQNINIASETLGRKSNCLNKNKKKTALFNAELRWCWYAGMMGGHSACTIRPNGVQRQRKQWFVWPRNQNQNRVMGHRVATMIMPKGRSIIIHIYTHLRTFGWIGRRVYGRRMMQVLMCRRACMHNAIQKTMVERQRCTAWLGTRTRYIGTDTHSQHIHRSVQVHTHAPSVIPYHLFLLLFFILVVSLRNMWNVGIAQAPEGTCHQLKNISMRTTSDEQIMSAWFLYIIVTRICAVAQFKCLY